MLVSSIMKLSARGFKVDSNCFRLNKTQSVIKKQNAMFYWLKLSR